MTRNVRLRAIIALAALGLAVSGAAPVARAQPAGAQNVSVTVSHAEPAVTATGTLDMVVSATLAQPAEYFEVRVRVRSETGRLIHQKTEVRHDVSAGRTELRFTRELAGLGLRPGRYPIEIRVLATGATATVLESRMLVRPDEWEPLPVAVVVRLGCAPALDTNGRFTRDPASDTALRDAIESIARVALTTPDRPLALAVPPISLEEALRAADGYEYAGPAGVTAVDDTSQAALSYRSAIEALRSSVASATLTLLDIPYAEPDLAGLEMIDAVDDLAAHWTKTDAIIGGVLSLPRSRGAALLSGPLPASALPHLERRGPAYVLVTPESLLVRSDAGVAGAYALRGTSLRALVADADLTEAARLGEEPLYDALYVRALVEDRAAAVILLEMGPGRLDSVDSLTTLIRRLERVGWVRLASLDSLAASPSQDGALATSVPGSPAPDDYWDEVARARIASRSFAAAVSPDDADGRAVADAILVAESGCWAGADSSWGLAEQGRAFASSAFRYVEKAYSSVRIDSKDVTLSDRSGDVPLTIVNGTGKPLRLTLRAESNGLATPPPALIDVEPGENFLTLPVDLGTVIADDLTLTLGAGDITVASTTVAVRGSYLDRIATIVMVVAVMAGLLVFIRRRVYAAAPAGTMHEDAEEADDTRL